MYCITIFFPAGGISGFAIGGGIALVIFVIVVAIVAYIVSKRVKRRQERTRVPKDETRLAHTMCTCTCLYAALK